MSGMMNKKDDVLHRLRDLNLTNEAAVLYLELLRGPNTHLKLAHATGINRTKVYRLVEDLQKRSLVTTRTDHHGTFLIATDPSTLEVELVNQEQKLKVQRDAFEQLMPVLTQLQNGLTTDFVIHTYDGAEGFKQMLWHELKSTGEYVIFGSGTIDDLIDDHEWAEKHRAMSVSIDSHIRELINPGHKPMNFTKNKQFMKNYLRRTISPDILPLEQQTSVYNDTVAIYNWRNERKVGIEIVNTAYAATMRHMFEHYWPLGTDV
jgi:hypothetical protein